MLSRNSLVPRPALFFVLLFAVTITYRSRRVEKNGEGLGAFITQMTSGGYEVDVGDNFLTGCKPTPIQLRPGSRM